MQIARLAACDRRHGQMFCKDLDAHFAAREYLRGDAITRADVDIVAVIHFAGGIRERVAENRPRDAGLHQRVKARVPGSP